MKKGHLILHCALPMLGLLHVDGLFAQVTWRKAFGALSEDDGARVRVAPDGNFIIVGSTGSFGHGSSDAYVLKIDGDGDLLWSTTVGEEQIDRATGLYIAPDGSLLMAGYTNGAGAGGYDGWLVRMNAQGEVQWQQRYGGAGWDFIEDVEPWSDGGWLLAGRTFSEGSGGSDGWALRTNADGEMVWSQTFGGAGEDGLYAGIQTTDGGYALAGFMSGPDGDTDAVVIKLHADGSPDWQRSIGGDSLDVAYDVIQTNDGGYSVVGSTHSYSPWTEHLHERLNSAGDSLWAHHWGQINDQEAREHIELADGRFAVVGYTKTSGGGKKDLFVQLADPGGEFIEQHTFGALEDDGGSSIALTPDGFVACGYTRSYGYGGSDVFVVRTDEHGNTATETVNETFDPLTVTEQEAGAQWNVVPNPVTDAFTIQGGSLPASARLFDEAGRAVRSWQGDPRARYAVSGLSAGTYVLVVRDGQGVTGRSVLVIQTR